MNNIDLNALFIIFCVAIGTYSLRYFGLVFSNRLKNEGNVKVFLDYLPSTLLLSLIAPAILKEGLLGFVATAFIALCMYKTKSILASMVLGVIVVAIGRNFI
ncbi:AzlD domain-containing protein [Sulfurospirillum arcachonense]|uniref:AzlD domain-containing protein n=1 Tax=Sulfurospirillum arcachonense TaxID=57666 RepID=UPI0004685F96|nr:AzlD domain-containing protein [Sulfurospirillum arcachonense]